MFKTIAAVLLTLASGQLYANERLVNQDVVKLGAYQSLTLHYVWFSGPVGAECRADAPQNSSYYYDEASPGGRAMTAILMAGLLNKRKVEIDTSGCKVLEVYIF